MSHLVVGVGDCRVTNQPDGVLVTYALGSCIAVMIHDPVAKVGGMLHFMLPDAGGDKERSQRNPFMYADSGIPTLFRSAYELGAQKKRLTVRLAGGAQMMDEGGVFNIGKRNSQAAQKILWKAGIIVQLDDVGGNSSRTAYLEIATGRVTLRGPGIKGDKVAAGGAEKEMGWPTT